MGQYCFARWRQSLSEHSMVGLQTASAAQATRRHHAACSLN